MTTDASCPPDDLSAARAPSVAGRGALALKALVTVALLAFLFSRSDWTAMGERLAEASAGLLALGVLVKALTVPFAAERWRAIASAAGVRFGSLMANRLMLVSVLFGQVLPGAVGGDIVRGWLTWRLGHSPSAVMMALVVDRLAALAGVVVVFCLGLAHLLSAAPPAVGWVFVLGAVVTLAGAAGALWLDRFPLPGLLRRLPIDGLLAAAGRIRATLTLRSGAVALGHSVAVHLCTVAATFVFARALALPVTALDCLAVVPFTIVAAALPVSLAGWGMREGAMAAGFALFGLPAGDALLLSLLVGGSALLMSLPGAALWLAWRHPQRPPAPQTGSAP